MRFSSLPSRVLVPALAFSASAVPGRAEITVASVSAQCAALKKNADDWLAYPGGHHALILVLGATTQEADRFALPQEEGGSTVRYIFLSMDEHKDPNPFRVQCDFNDLAHMNLVSAVLRRKLTAVIPDRSVMKFTRWKEGFLGLVKGMLAPGGTLFVPLETYDGIIHLGVAPEGAADPDEFRPPSGDREQDVKRLAQTIERAMVNHEYPGPGPARLRPMLPGALWVPKSWLLYDPALQTLAVDTWKRDYLAPRLIGALRGLFGTVTLVRFAPSFLQGTPDAAPAMYLACKP